MNRYKSVNKPMMWTTTFMLAALVAGCGGTSGNPSKVENVGVSCTGASCVNLGTAGNYAILAKTGVSTTGVTAVTGNLGLSPAAGSYFTGWSERADGVPTSYSTSSYVTGKLYAANYSAATTSVDLTTAIGDMQTAHTTANGLPASGGALAGGVPGTLCPGVGGTGDLSGQTIRAGVYSCTVNLAIPAAAVTFDGNGDSTSVFVIRTTQNFSTTAAGPKVTLTGGALAQNIFWVVDGATSISAGANIKGIILDKTAISMLTGSTIDGRLLAQSAVTLQAVRVTQPAL